MVESPCCTFLYVCLPSRRLVCMSWVASEERYNHQHLLQQLLLGAVWNSQGKRRVQGLKLDGRELF